MLDEYIKKLVDYLKNGKLRNNIILLLSVISINFASYIAFFDLNSLSIVDSSTISRHILNLVIPYILVSVLVTLIIHLINFNFEYSKVIDVFKYGVREGKFSKLIKLVMKFSNGTMIKYGIIVLLFCFYYIGTDLTLAILLIFCMFVLIFILTYIMYSFVNKIFIKHIIKNSAIEKDRLELQNILNKKINYKSMLINNIGILIVLFSLILGMARATHVYVTNYVKINDNNTSYILYMATMSGVGLYDKKLQQVSFKSWDTINNIEFSIATKKSIGTFFDQFSSFKSN